MEFFTFLLAFFAALWFNSNLHYNDYADYNYDYDTDYNYNYEYDYVKEEFEWIAEDIIAEWGITLDVYYNDSLAWKPYYALAVYPERTKTYDLEGFNDELVFEYMYENLDVLYYEYHVLWAWVSEWKVYLDVSLALPKTCSEDVMAMWAKYNKRMMFDLETMKDIAIEWQTTVKKYTEDDIWDDIDAMYEKWCLDEYEYY